PYARWNVVPNRALNIPCHPCQMAADDDQHFLYMTIQSDNQISVYRKQASGGEKPVRTIRGNDTRLEDPHGLALDLKNRLIFVSNFGNGNVRGTGGRYGTFAPPSITVYPMEGSGNIKPVRVIAGLKTLMNWPAHMTFHQTSPALLVANHTNNS